MTDIEPIDRQSLFSIARLAAEFEMGRDTVSKRLQQGAVRPAGMRNGHPVYKLIDAVPALGVGGVGDDVDFDPARIRPSDQLALAKAAESRTDNLLKLRKLQKEEGSLVEAAAVRLQMSEIAQGAVQLFDILMDILERDCDLPPKAVVRGKEVIDRERMKLAELLEG